jgi:hypothetical protein
MLLQHFKTVYSLRIAPPTRKWEDNIITGLGQSGGEDVNWIDLVHDIITQVVSGFCVTYTESSDFMRAVFFLPSFHCFHIVCSIGLPDVA